MQPPLRAATAARGLCATRSRATRPRGNGGSAFSTQCTGCAKGMAACLQRVPMDCVQSIQLEKKGEAGVRRKDALAPHMCKACAGSTAGTTVARCAAALTSSTVQTSAKGTRPPESARTATALPPQTQEGNAKNTEDGGRVLLLGARRRHRRAACAPSMAGKGCVRTMGAASLRWRVASAQSTVGKVCAQRRGAIQAPSLEICVQNTAPSGASVLHPDAPRWRRPGGSATNTEGPGCARSMGAASGCKRAASASPTAGGGRRGSIWNDQGFFLMILSFLYCRHTNYRVTPPRSRERPRKNTLLGAREIAHIMQQDTLSIYNF